jgi:uncharacterized protein (DUF1330 family)
MDGRPSMRSVCVLSTPFLARLTWMRPLSSSIIFQVNSQSSLALPGGPNGYLSPRASIRNSGGKPVAASQKVVALEGTAPSSRITINVFDSLEKAQAWRNGTEYKEARKIGDKYAKFRAYVVDGVPQ